MKSECKDNIVRFWPEDELDVEALVIMYSNMVDICICGLVANEGEVTELWAGYA